MFTKCVRIKLIVVRFALALNGIVNGSGRVAGSHGAPQRVTGTLCTLGFWIPLGNLGKDLNAIIDQCACLDYKLSVQMSFLTQMKIQFICMGLIFDFSGVHFVMFFFI